MKINFYFRYTLLFFRPTIFFFSKKTPTFAKIKPYKIMQTIIKLFIFAAIYMGAIVNVAQTNTVWTGDLSYRIIHLLLFITSIIALISHPKVKDGKQSPWHAISRWCFLIACLTYALTYLSAVIVHDIPLLTA